MKKFEGFIVKLTNKCIITRRKKIGAREYRLYFNGDFNGDISLDILINRKGFDEFYVRFLMNTLNNFFYKVAHTKKEVSQIFMEFVQSVEKYHVSN